MSKKYLSLDEAASMLGIPREELTRLRERGELRGFADRGTWKFKFEDVQNLGRSRQMDSDPDVPLINESALSDSGSGSGSDLPARGPSDSSTVLGGSDPLSTSDSDVRLIMEGAAASSSDMSDSDSDVKLVGEGSDSDVKLADEADSDSDVKLVGDETVRELNVPPSLADSDSDVKIVPGKGGKSKESLSDTLADKSDSDVQIIDDKAKSEAASDSDVAILGSDSDIALDFATDEGESSSVLADESGAGISGSGLLGKGSGISLSGPSDSGISLGADEDEGITLAPDKSDSGISLAGAESGISLAGGDSGISLSSADSGISLEAVADSGISLEDSSEFTGTVPMMNAVKDVDTGPETKFEIPSLKSDDSAFEMKGRGADETGVMDLADSDEGSLDDAVFDLDEAGGDAADLEVADDITGEDDEVEELDVFDADEDAFAGAEEEEEMGGMVGRAMVPAEEEWSTPLVLGLGVSCVLTLLCGFLMFDLVRSMWLWGDRPPEPGMLLGLFSGLMGK